MIQTLTERWGALVTPPWQMATAGGMHQALRRFASPGAFPVAAQYDALWPDGDSHILGRIGSLEIRLARKRGDIRRAQRLRYQVFYEEMSALADPMQQFTRRDFDMFDAVCDHLLVVDRGLPSGKKGRKNVVGTYRLLTQAAAQAHGGFYTSGEYDVAPLMQRHRDLRFLELGRSCVLPTYRNKRTIELLWRGIWAYVQRHQVDALIGCASFEGTSADRLASPLSFLHHYASAPPDWQVCAHAHRYVEMNRLPKRMVDHKAALRELPPLIKGYLRVGAFVGAGAVIDRKFGTTDVCVILPISHIKSRYVDHFGTAPEALAA